MTDKQANDSEEEQIHVTVLRCSRCNQRLYTSSATAICGNCGAAYKRDNGEWGVDLIRWSTKNGYKRIVG